VGSFLLTLLLGLTFSAVTVNDGPIPIDPLLLHPISRSLCCCQNSAECAEERSDDEDIAEKILVKLVNFVNPRCLRVKKGSFNYFQNVKIVDGDYNL